MHRVELPDWAIERGRWANDFPGLEPGRTALVVIDMQVAFMAEGQPFANGHARDIAPAINALARAFRAAGAPVIWTRQTVVAEQPLAPADWHYDLSSPEVARAVAALTPGAEGREIDCSLDVGPTDLVLDKHRYGAFACPAQALPRALERLGIRMLVVAGTLTNVCCETTAREAYMAGYKVICVADAMAGATDAEHNAALMNLRLNFADVRSTAEVLAMAAALAQGQE